MPYAALGKVSQAPIPEGIEISEDQYREAIGGMMRGEVVSIAEGFKVAPPEPEPEPEPEPPTLKETREAKRDEINAAYRAALAVILDKYPEAEREGWYKQEAEARAWTDDETEPTPYLDRLAASRGVELSAIAAKVIEKADAWISLSGDATGKRQRLEESIDAAGTITDLEAIAW